MGKGSTLTNRVHGERNEDLGIFLCVLCVLCGEKKKLLSSPTIN